MRAQLNKWTDALGGRPFMGGASPGLADVALFGVLRAVRGFDTFRDAVAHTQVGPWFGRMEAAVGPSARVAGGDGGGPAPAAAAPAPAAAK